MHSGALLSSTSRLRALIVTVTCLCTIGLGAWLVPAISGPDPLEGPAAAVTGAHDDTHTPFNLVSMPALISHRYDAAPLRSTGTTVPGPGFVRHAISYANGSLRITGTLVMPRHRRVGGVPVVVAVHGWAEPGIYRRGAGLSREERALAQAGFAVLHPDLRNFGGSTVESGRPEAAPLGYPSDVIAGVLALRASRIAGLDTGTVGLLGRSMGGGVALQAAIARPDLFDAVALYSPVSSLASDNLTHFGSWSRGLDERVRAAYGTPQSRPTFWLEASARSYLDRLTMPVVIHHGEDDVVTLPAWSRSTVGAMRRDGVDAEFVGWPGERHRFTRSWPRFAAEVTAFFERAAA